MLLAVENLSHWYGDHTVLENFFLHLNRREILGILGPNGSGKSTFLRVLSTLVRPQTGKVEVCGFDVARHPDAVRARIGVVFQTQTLDKLLTVEENLMAWGTFYGLKGHGLIERVREALGKLKLEDRRRQVAGTLSGGLQRRAEIARALLHQPQLLILDEPTTGLDPNARDDFWDALESLRQGHDTGVVLSTHLFEEAEQCDTLVMLNRGRRVAEGSPGELKATIGGNIIELRAKETEQALELLEERLGYEPVLADGVIRVETMGAAEAIPRIVDVLSGGVVSIGFREPTLADVYRKVTEHAQRKVAAQ
jgi:ABC-2 type transport system ATP-binding protein